MRASTYYAAARALPAAYAGFATAAIMLAMLLPFAARLAGRSWVFGVVAGAFVGLGAGALFLGPLLRKTGAFTLSDLLAARFPGLAPRLLLIVAAASSSALLAIAGTSIAVDAFVDFTGASRVFAGFLICATALVIAGPGGLAGVIWCAAATAGVALLGFGWPIAALGVNGALPVGLLGGDGWRDAAALLAQWRAAPAPMSVFVELCATSAVALGVATLTPVLAPAITVADHQAARRAGYGAFFWTIVLALFAGVIVASAALTLSATVKGQPAEQLPGAVYEASGRGLIAICGMRAASPSEAQRACAKQGAAPGAPLGPAQLRPADGVYLLGSLPNWTSLGAAASGLLASATVALGVALAAAGLQACATAVGHDAVYRLRGEIDLTSRRLAIDRVTLVLVAALAYAVAARGVSSPGVLIVLALAISAACIAPLVALAFWSRAGDREALAALIGGASMLSLLLIVAAGAGQVEVYALSALFAALTALGAGAASALASRKEKPEAQAFILRMLRGDAQMVEPDKGA